VNITADIEVFLSRISQLVNLKTTAVNRLPLLIQAVDETIVVEFLEDAHISKLLRLGCPGFGIFSEIKIRKLIMEGLLFLINLKCELYKIDWYRCAPPILQLDFST
jgi:hypothetical protein